MAHNIAPRICIICGETYKPTSSTQKCCGEECKKIHRGTYKKKMYKKQNAIPRKKKTNGLVEINKLARESGMTYGQYMAEQYRKGQ